MSPLHARALYSDRLAQRTAVADARRARERTLSIARLLVVVAAIAIAFWSVSIALIPFAAFIALIIIHERVVRARKRAENGATFYARGLARINGTWPGQGDGGDALADEHHPFAGDFDLFGHGSLFELISLAVTRAGRTRLGAWLKEPSQDADEIRARQDAVRELRDNVDLREDLALEAAEVAHEIESAKLDAWAAMAALHASRFERVAALVLPVISIPALLLALPALVARVVGWTHPEATARLGVFAAMPVWPFLLAAFATALLSRRLRSRVEPVIMAVERAEPALALLGGVLSRIERETFTSARLVTLSARLSGPASRDIERLRRLVALLDARRNQFFAPIAALMLWGTNVAFAIDRWRERHGASVVEWIETVGEIEALSSLASFAFEHPTFVMPEIASDGPLFDARALGHPLIPEDRRVTNDIRLDATLRLLVVSGSNMSGKSTMLRSVGIAAVLAMAGGPVCAESLRVTPARVGASIRIHDSLQENASRFYAEILRIRQVIAMSRDGALLFLLDEVLAGTNSHDRRIGAEAIVRGLVERGAIGLVSTHDLALADIADTLAPRAANVHFEDHIEDGRVVFDYRMREGVVTKSNALALMRSVGIEV